MRPLETFGAIGAGLLVLVAIIGLSVGVFLVGQQVRRWVAPIEGETGVTEFRESAENRIARYEHFFNLCASVQTNETRIDQFSEDLDNYEPGTRDYSRVSSNRNAAIIARADAINQYNADASKDYTGAEFRDSDLPFHLSTAAYEGGKTRCAAQ